jgi:hypothetical protein
MSTKMRTGFWIVSAGFAALAALGSAQAAAPSAQAQKQLADSLKGGIDLLLPKNAPESQRLALNGIQDVALSADTSGEATVPDNGLVAPQPPSEPAAETATKNDIEGLRADFENYKYEQQRATDRTTAKTTRGTTIGGTVQARANALTPEAKPGSAVVSGATPVVAQRTSSYDIPSASFNFAGSLFRDYNEGRNLDYRVQLAYARSNPASDNSVFNLTDAYLRYSLLSTNSLEDAVLNVTLGQQQIPFGLEAQTGEELRPVINSAQFLGGTGVSKRQVGLIARGDLLPQVDYGFNFRSPILEYAFGIFNGSGPNKSDDNDGKDLIGRAALTLPADYNSWFRQLKVGGSYYRGQKNVNKTTTTPAVAAVPATANAPAKAAVAATSTTVVGNDKGKSERWGADLYYNHAPFGVTYEYVFSRDAQAWTTSAAKPAGETITSGEGQVVTAFFTFGEQWFASSKTKGKYDDFWPKSYQFFGRYDVWNPDQTLAKNDRTVYTAGFNWFFAQTTKLQLNYNYYTFEDPAKSEVKEYLGQFQFGF